MHRMRWGVVGAIAAVLLCASAPSAQAEGVTSTGVLPDAPHGFRLKRITIDHALDGTTFVIKVPHLTRRGVFAFGGAEADGDGYFFVSAFHQGRRVKVTSYGNVQSDEDYEHCAGVRVRWQVKRHRIVTIVPDECYESSGSGDMNYEVDSFVDKAHWRRWDQADTTSLVDLAGIAAG